MEEKDIEVTPAMMDAGANAFLRYNGGAEILIGDERTAAYAVFKPMLRAAPRGAYPLSNGKLCLSRRRFA